MEASRLPEQAAQLHALAGRALSHQLHLAAQLPRNYIVDQAKCASTRAPRAGWEPVVSERSK